MTPTHLELRDTALALKRTLDDVARGGDRWAPILQIEYRKKRDQLIQFGGVADVLPEVVRTCRELTDFWHFIRPKFSTYAERTLYLKQVFEPLLGYLEAPVMAPADRVLASHFERFGGETLHSIWTRALDRKKSDPEGAITLAKSMVESTFKHILDDLGEPYGSGDDLPKLQRIVSRSLNLSPSQHTEEMFKQVLSGCASIVQGLGAIRSKLGDSHGMGKGAPRPSGRHAELAINVAGAMAGFLICTYEERKSKGMESATARRPPARVSLSERRKE